ncbi:MAG TPA: FumA C-terminus/TtdB family hydratase beta subunit [Candidatus Marinimicrobia bacterium]|jgi:fumarate hydratase class I|nr:FumA C-terminus/TtdB family hydratase beta subunit [Candidatus Neomarinimicrobiota bacterium]HJL85111.1 FumA C-terminus/TtdB family hydratase beta subunit [Candidatus Neomarinimicrobiota bacterium]|tara:strand:+ start:416 stop:994 length:579 start_codon:yes stop_codon:yes gene_type:complete
MISLKLPVSEEEVRKLKVGDEVSLNGIMVLGRDNAHAWMYEEKPNEIRNLLKGTVIYHCGPVVKKVDDEWIFVAAGPTTSIREEPYQGDVLKEYDLRAVIGKGGMGDKTLAALKEHGAVYLHAIGGTAALLAKAVVKVHDVLKLEEFGIPEAMWVIEVKDFPTVVTMDSHGQSLHQVIKGKSNIVADKLISG